MSWRNFKKLFSLAENTAKVITYLTSDN